MKYESITNWGDYRHDGLLYFAQRVNEMLSNDTDHIYKAPIYNTKLLVREYIKTSLLVDKSAVHENHLKSIIEEFQNSFSTDVVVAEHINEEKRQQLIRELNSPSKSKQRRIMKYISYLLSDYDYWCKNYLNSIVRKDREKKKIESAIRCYIPGLISGGYSRNFIYRYNKEVFFEKSVSSIDSLSTFLDRFDYQEQEYDVFIAVDPNVNEFKTILEKRLAVDFGPFNDIPRIKHDSSRYQIIKVHCKALDEDCAAKSAYNHLNLFFRYYCFFRDQKNSWFYEKAIVRAENGDIYILDLQDQAQTYTNVGDHGHMGKVSEAVITALVKNPSASFSAIDRAIIAHNNAVNDSNIKNRFLNYWSILEILFVSENSESKISEIREKIVPILSRDYIITLFYTTEHDVIENVDKDVLEKLSYSSENRPDGKWIYDCLTGEDSENILSILYNALNDFPLIRTRISVLHEKCHNKNLLLKDVKRFSNRISWHVIRLYRARNAIIHSGLNPYNIVELVEHLHCYVDECILELLYLLTVNSKLLTINNVVLDSEFKLTDIGMRLQGKGSLTQDDYALLFSRVQ